MSVNTVKAGELVRSLAGRDKDGYFVAVSVSGKRVYIADGRKHRLSAPKAKNPRHISPVGMTVDTSELGDKMLRRLIAQLKTQSEAEPEKHRPLKDG